MVYGLRSANFRSKIVLLNIIVQLSFSTSQFALHENLIPLSACQQNIYPIILWYSVHCTKRYMYGLHIRTGEIPDLEGVVSCDLDEVLRWDLLGLLFSKCAGVYPTVS